MNAVMNKLMLFKAVKPAKHGAKAQF